LRQALLERTEVGDRGAIGRVAVERFNLDRRWVRRPLA
jgi:hypothetical protein